MYYHRKLMRGEFLCAKTVQQMTFLGHFYNTRAPNGSFLGISVQKA